MGNFCGTDLYKQVKDKYKSEFTKFIVTRNTIKTLDDAVQKSKKEIQQKLTEVKSQKLKAIDHTSTQITQNYFSNLKLIDQKHAGGIKSLQKIKHAKIDQLMGYTYYQEKISQLKHDTNEKFTQITRQLLNEIDNIHRYHRNKLREDQPDLVLFNQLQPEVQKQLFAQGTEEFKEQVQKSESHLRNSLGNKLDAKHHIERIQNILPQESLEGLVNLSKEKFQNSVELLTAGTLKDLPKIY